MATKGRPTAKLCLACAGLLAVLALSGRPAFSAEPAKWKTPAWAGSVSWQGKTHPVVRDRLIVKFRPGAPGREHDAVLSRAGVRTQERLDFIGARVISLPAGRNLAKVAQALERSPVVEWAEPDFLAHSMPFPAPDDPFYQGSQSPPQAYLPQIKIDSAWNDGLILGSRGGTAFVVAVIDSGVDYTHPDFTFSATGTRILISPAGNGPPLGGQFVVGKDYWPSTDDDPMDENGHGTMVAGFMGAATDNAAGVAGMTWYPKLMPIKVLGASGGGGYSALIKGLEFARVNGAHVINMSLGGPAYSKSLALAIKAVADAGIVMFAAAGNDGGPVNYPAAYPEVITVGSVDEDDAHSTFSCSGPELILVAPGESSVGLVSTDVGGGYSAGVGTSFASPLAAGLGADLLAQNPDWAPETVLRRLIQTCDKVPPPGGNVYDADGFEEHMGYGRANAFRALGGLSMMPGEEVSAYLRDSETVLSNPSGPDPIARHRFAGPAAGMVTFNIGINDLNWMVWEGFVQIRDLDGVVVDTVWLMDMWDYWTVDYVMSSQPGFASRTYIPRAVFEDWMIVQFSIPLPAFTVPGVDPVRLEAVANPDPNEAGGVSRIEVRALDGMNNAIGGVPIRAMLVSSPGPASLSSLWGETGGAQVVFPTDLTLSPVPGDHLVVFSVSATGLEDIEVSLTVTGLPRVVLEKMVTPAGTVCTERILRYRLTWYKPGSSTAYGLTITDTLPNGTSYRSPSLDLYAEPDDLGTPSLVSVARAPDSAGPWTDGEPADGAVVPLALRWVIDRVAPGRSGYLEFEAEVSGTLAGGSLVANTCSATFMAESGIFLSGNVLSPVDVPWPIVTSSAAPAAAGVGQWVELTVTATNTGGVNATVDPAIAVNPGSGLVSPIAGPVPAGPVLLAPGAAQTFIWTYSVSGEGKVVFTVTASGSLCASEVREVVLVSAVNLEAVMRFLTNPASLGQNVILEMTVTNTGLVTAGGLDVVSLAAAGGGAVALADGPHPAPPVDLGPGESLTFTWTYTAVTVGTVDLSATLTAAFAGTGETFSRGPVVSDVLLIQVPAALEGGPPAVIPDPACVGNPIEVTMTVTNTGTATARDVTGSPLLRVEGTGSAGPLSSPAVIPVLAGGASVTLTWTYSPAAPGTVKFTATITAEDANSGFFVSSGAWTSAVTTVNGGGGLDGAVAVPSSACIGDVLAVSFTVTNPGATNADAVVPSLTPIAGGPLVIPGSGPSPPGPVTLGPGAGQTFSWTMTVVGSGVFSFVVAAEGAESVTGCPLRASRDLSTSLLGVGELSSKLALNPYPVPVGGQVVITHHVTNTGVSAAGGIFSELAVNSGAGLMSYVSGPLPAGPVSIPAGDSATFTWVYDANSAGTVSCTATATGMDTCTGTPVTSSDSWAAVVTLAMPAGSCPPQEAWERIYDSSLMTDRAKGVATDADSNVVVVGYDYLIGQGYNWRIEKMDSSGNPIWNRSHNGTANSTDQAHDVAVDAVGNVIVAGYQYVSLESNNWLVRKYDRDGSLIWSRTYNSPGNSADIASSVAVDGMGNVAVAGEVYRSDILEGANWHVRKYDRDGNFLWSAEHNSPSDVNDRAYGVAFDPMGNVIVVGPENRQDLGQWYDWLIRKFDPDGNVLWDRSYNGAASSTDYPYGVATDASGNIVVVGYEYVSLESYNWLIRKYDQNGNLIWTRGYDSPYHSSDQAYDVAIDAAGNVVVGGAEYRNDLGEGENWLIRKYDSSGSLIWGKSYDAFKDYDRVEGVAVDSTGAVLAAGYQDSVSYDWRTAKYAEAMACLEALLSVNPSYAPVGSWLEVVLSVTNNGSVAVNGVLPSLDVTVGASRLDYISGPLPAGPVVIGPGASQLFTWTYSVSGMGAVQFTGTAAGTDSGTGNPVSAWDDEWAQEASIVIYGPALSTHYQNVPGTKAVVWDAATWLSKTTADFFAFDAIVIGGPGGTSETIWNTAAANRSVWTAAITGNVIIAGTDAEEHNKTVFVNQAVLFAVDDPAPGPGLYVELHDYAPMVPTNPQFLQDLGDFLVSDGTCGNTVHKIAEHPVLDTLTDADLSNWSCTPHSGFDEWPSGFAPLAMDMSAGAKQYYKACDSTIGHVCMVASGVTPVCGEPELTKESFPPDIAKIDSELIYRISWVNIGNDTIPAMTITDTLPNGTTYLAPSLAFFAESDWIGTPSLVSTAHAATPAGPWTAGEPADGTAPPRVMRWVVDRVAPGRSGYVEFKVKISATLFAGSLVVNEVSATIPATTNAYRTRDITEVRGLYVALTKTPSAWVVSSGSQLTYTIEYVNSVNDTATNVILWDTLPDGTGFGSATGGGSFDGTKVIWSFPAMSPGESGSVSFTVTVTGEGTAVGPNLALMEVYDSALELQPLLTSNPVTVVVRQARLNFAKWSDPAEDVCEGVPLTYILRITNVGTDVAREITVWDTLSAGLDYVSCVGGGTCWHDGGKVVFFQPELSPGAAVRLEITVTANGALEIPNVAEAVYANGATVWQEPIKSNALSVSMLSGTLVVAKEVAPPDTAAAGQEIVYRISWSNIGCSRLRDLTITDTLPNGTFYVSPGQSFWAQDDLWGTPSLVNAEYGPSASGPWTPGEPPDGTGPPLVMRWVIDRVAPDRSGWMKFRVRLSATLGEGDIVVNTGSATVLDDSGAYSTGPATTLIQGPFLVLSKSVSGAAGACEGDLVDYGIEVANTGSDTALGISVWDTLPAGALYYGCAGGTGCWYDGTKVWFELAPLGPGVADSLTVTVSVTGALAAPNLAEARYANTSTVWAAPVMSNPLALTGLAGIPVLGKLSAPSGGVLAGQEVTYRVSWSNAGCVRLEEIAILDTLPAGTSCVSPSRVFWSETDQWGTPSLISAEYAPTASGPWSAGEPSDGAAPPLVMRWVIDRVAGGRSGWIEFKVRADPGLPAGFAIANTASATLLGDGRVYTTAPTSNVIRSPDLSVMKSAGSSAVPVGGILAYELAVINVGDATALNVAVWDTVPAGTIFDSASGGGIYDGTTVSWGLPDISPGTSAYVSFSVMVPGPGPVVGPNRAAAYYENSLAAARPLAVSNPVSVPVVQAALALEKSAAPNPVGVGGTLTYTVTVTNAGTDTAWQVSVWDTLPAGVSFADCDGGVSCAFDGVKVVFALSPVPPGVSVPLTVSVTASAGLSGANLAYADFANSASIWQPTAASNPVTVTTAQATIDLDKSPDRPRISSGQQVVYSIVCRNTGSDTATSVAIRDTLPPGAAFVSASAGGAYDGTGVTWSFPGVSPGGVQTADVTVVLTSTSCGMVLVDNEAGVSFRNSSGVPRPYMAVAPVSVTLINSRVVLTQSADRVEVAAGEPVTYTLVFSNACTDTATGLVLWETLPAGLAFVSADGGGVFSGGMISWNLGDLLPGGGGNVSFVASVTSTGPGIGPDRALLRHGNGAGMVQPPVVSNPVTLDVLNPRLTLDKMAPVEAKMEEPFAFTIQVVNTGSETAENVVVVDTLPASLEFVSATGDPEYHGRVITWNVGTLDVGGSAEFTVRAVLPPVTRDVVVLNRAHATFTYSSGSPGPTARDSVTVKASPPLVLRIYPNPFNPAQAVGGTIKFAGLPEGSEVRIYTLSGTLLRTLTGVSRRRLEWDGRNEEGTEVASGIYLYLVEYPEEGGGRGRKTGKIGLIR